MKTRREFFKYFTISGVSAAVGAVVGKANSPHPETLISRGRVFQQLENLSEMQGLGAVAEGKKVEIKGRSIVGVGGGKYVARVGDYSDEVSADEVTVGEGDGAEWVAFGSDKTGASGAWELIDQDQPVYEQYGKFLSQLTRMRGGESFALGRALPKGDFAAVQAEENTDNHHDLINNVLSDASSLIVPQGLWNVGEDLLYQRAGQGIEGHGAGRTRIVGTSINGAVLRLKDFHQKVSRLTIDANATRKAAVRGTNFGIQVEPSDLENIEAKFPILNHVHVLNQPSHGVVFAGSFFAGGIEKFRISNCGGHGLVIDNGTITGRVNLKAAGWLTIADGVIQDCLGHSISCGADGENNNVPYRIEIKNVDQFRCALAAGIRKESTCAYIFGENIDVYRNAFCGYTHGGVEGIGQGAATVSGLTLAGRGVRVINNRFIDVLNYVARVVELADASTRDIKIKTFRLTGNSQPNLPYAVLNAASRAQVKVENQTYFNFDKLVSNDEVILSDNKAFYLRFSDVARGVLSISSNTMAAGAAVVHFRCGDGAAFVDVMSSGAGATINTGVGTLGGTTGPDAGLNIYVDTATNRLYIENRTGVSGSYSVELQSKNSVVLENIVEV